MRIWCLGLAQAIKSVILGSVTGNLLAVWTVAAGVGRLREPLMAVLNSAAPSQPHSHPWLAELLFAFDATLRRRHAVFEYSDNPSCVFRLGIVRARRPLTLRDGTLVAAGQRMARIHFWNEHVPHMPTRGPTIGWARHMQQVMALSLGELARYLETRPDFGDITVIDARAPTATSAQTDQLARIMARFGFETLPEPESLGIVDRAHLLGENFLISMLVLAQNGAALRADTLNRVRLPIYLSRRTLENKFGTPPAAANAAGGPS